MGKLVSGNNCSDAWLLATDHILCCGGDCFNVVVEIENPASENLETRKLLDTFLETKGKKPIEEVANTIFPSSLYFPSSGRNQLYENYEAAWPLIKLFNNIWGTYFYRMIHWEDRGRSINQLECTIEKLLETQSGMPRYKSTYEVSVYRPQNDRFIRRGAPCLSHLSFKLENGALFLTVVYRNHFYIERAYGNFIGLGRLIDFVAKESKLSVGKLTCVSTHAELGFSKSSVMSLMNSCANYLHIDTHNK